VPRSGSCGSPTPPACRCRRIRARTPLGSKLQLTGTIDADYRGEVLVILVNLGDEPFAVERGARIAQLVLAATSQAREFLTW